MDMTRFIIPPVPLYRLSTVQRAERRYRRLQEAVADIHDRDEFRCGRLTRSKSADRRLTELFRQIRQTEEIYMFGDIPCSGNEAHFCHVGVHTEDFTG